MPRSEILDNPLSTTSCALKPPVRAKLDSIASATQAIISVVNPDLQTDKLESSGKPSSGTNGQGGGDPGAVGAPLMQGSSAQATKGAFGLETERICEIVVEGALGAIEVAKVRLLVMLDELVRSVHSLSRKEVELIFLSTCVTSPVSTLKSARSTSSYTPSSPLENDMSSRRSRRKRAQISTSPRRFVASPLLRLPHFNHQ